MSQLDISVFYSHLFCLLLFLYIFSHMIIMVIINYYYNLKVRELDNESIFNIEENLNNINILTKILN